MGTTLVGIFLPLNLLCTTFFCSVSLGTSYKYEGNLTITPPLSNTSFSSLFHVPLTLPSITQTQHTNNNISNLLMLARPFLYTPQTKVIPNFANFYSLYHAHYVTYLLKQVLVEHFRVNGCTLLGLYCYVTPSCKLSGRSFYCARF